MGRCEQAAAAAQLALGNGGWKPPCPSSYASPDVLGVSLLEESQASKDQTPLGVSMVLECRWPHNQPLLNQVVLFSVDRGYFGSLRSIYAHTECFRWRPGGPAPLGAGPASKRDQVVQCRVPQGTGDAAPSRGSRGRQPSCADSAPPPEPGSVRAASQQVPGCPPRRDTRFQTAHVAGGSGEEPMDLVVGIR
ncbi:unnamed protein product [Bubo scandiacus]